jgi:hypothetical protein
MIKRINNSLDKLEAAGSLAGRLRVIIVGGSALTGMKSEVNAKLHKLGLVTWWHQQLYQSNGKKRTHPFKAGKHDREEYSRQTRNMVLCIGERQVLV